MEKKNTRCKLNFRSDINSDSDLLVPNVCRFRSDPYKPKNQGSGSGSGSGFVYILCVWLWGLFSDMDLGLDSGPATGLVQTWILHLQKVECSKNSRNSMGPNRTWSVSVCINYAAILNMRGGQDRGYRCGPLGIQALNLDLDLAHRPIAMRTSASLWTSPERDRKHLNIDLFKGNEMTW